MIHHEIYRITKIRVIGPYTLKIWFDDGVERTIHFRDILYGPIYGPLRDQKLFEQVTIDPEIHTLVWPNGADFDPETLHNWPDYAGIMKEMAQRWAEEQKQAA